MASVGSRWRGNRKCAANELVLGWAYLVGLEAVQQLVAAVESARMTSEEFCIVRHETRSHNVWVLTARLVLRG